MRRSLLAVLVSLSAAFLLTEVAARLLLTPEPEPRRTEPADAPRIHPLGGQMYVYEPGTHFAHLYDPRLDSRGYLGPDGRVEYRINNLGLRGPDVVPVAEPGIRRILLLGDSVTFGEGVRYEDTFGERLSSLLENVWAPDQPEVINAGVQGFGTVQEVALYHALSWLEPEVVVLVLFLNDAMPGGETIRFHQEQMEAPKRTGFARISRVARTWQSWQKGRDLQAEYLAALAASLEAESPGWQACESALVEFGGEMKASGSRGVIVIFPLLHDLSAYPFPEVHERVTRLGQENGCVVVDLLETLESESATDLWVHPTDPHPNERAHALAAEVIFSAVVGL